MVDVFGDVADSLKEDHSQVSFLNHFFAGWIGGSSGIIVGHPLDTIKVRVQTTEGRASFSRTLSGIKHFGLSGGFYRGVSFPTASQGVLCALFFTGYGYSSDLLRKNFSEYSETTRAFIAGCIGGAVQVLPCCPVEIVKCNLQARISPESNRYYQGPFDCLRSIYRSRGLQGCFRGLGIHTTRDILGFGIYTAGNITWLDTSHALSSGSFLAGGLAGSVSWFIVTPLDVLKSRIQSNDMGLGPFQLLKFVREIAGNEGWRVFFKGGLMSTLRAFPVNTVTLPLYHFCEQSLRGVV